MRRPLLQDRRWLRRAVRPRPSWVTFLVLFLSLWVVTLSVELARWVESPSLAVTALWGMLAAAVLSHVRRAWIAHAAALVVGVAVTLWLTSGLVADVPDRWAAFEALFARLGRWGEAAVTGGISNDTLAFALVLVAGSWLVGYLSAWFVHRHQNIWGGVLPGALALLTNLTYLPGEFLRFFFIYILLAMVLVVWMHALGRQAEWRRRGAPPSWSATALSLNDALWLGAAIVLVGALLPMRSVTAEPLRRGYEQMRYPLEVTEEHFNRLFSGLPARKELPIRSFGTALPFQGSISPAPLEVFTADSPYPTYWPVRRYDRYSSQGWLARESETRPPDWTPPYAEPRQTLNRMTVEQGVELNLATSAVLMGGEPEAVSRPAELVVPKNRIYELDLDETSTSDDSLPPDLARWLERTRRVTGTAGPEEGSSAGRTSSAGAGAFPDPYLPDLPAETALVTVEVETAAGETKSFSMPEQVPTERSVPLALQTGRYRLRADDGTASITVMRDLSGLEVNKGRLASVTVTRLQPLPADILAVRSESRMSPGTTYGVRSSISVATAEQLRQAGTSYPRWVTDRYLQLPDSLPERVHELAQRLTEGATNPYDKAERVSSFLRRFEYTLEIPSPPHDRDGTDYFLFSLQKGYSDYFASAMTVLMRASGVPARLAAGYGPGTWSSQQGAYVVRDKDSHAWPEVYFPRYGWIVFEPTPSHERPERGMPTPAGQERPQAPASEELELEESFGDEFLLEEGQASELEGEGVGVAPPEETGGVPRGLLVAAVLVVLVAGMGLVWFFTWQRGIGVLGTPERAYERMRRLASVARLGPQPTQTPYEFAQALGTEMPSVRWQVRVICDAYVRSQYGREQLSAAEQHELWQAWQRVQRSLLRQLLRVKVRRG